MTWLHLASRIYDPQLVPGHILSTRCRAASSLTYLLKLEVLALGKLNLIPNNFHPFLCVHRQVGIIDPWDVALIHLDRQMGTDVRPKCRKPPPTPQSLIYSFLTHGI